MPPSTPAADPCVTVLQRAARIAETGPSQTYQSATRWLSTHRATRSRVRAISRSSSTLSAAIFAASRRAISRANSGPETARSWSLSASAKSSRACCRRAADVSTIGDPPVGITRAMMPGWRFFQSANAARVSVELWLLPRIRTSGSASAVAPGAWVSTGRGPCRTCGEDAPEIAGTTRIKARQVFKGAIIAQSDFHDTRSRYPHFDDSTRR